MILKSSQDKVLVSGQQNDFAPMFFFGNKKELINQGGCYCPEPCNCTCTCAV